MTVADILGCAAKKPMHEKDDFFETPKDCVEALIKAEGRKIPRLVWEPACGKGAIAEVLKGMLGANIVVHCTDLVDRGYGLPRVDFLIEQGPLAVPEGKADSIITNPPWKLGHDFALHAGAIGIQYMALLVKSSFFNSLRGAKVWGRWQPARIYSMNWRPDFTGGEAPPMTCDWVVWDGHPGFTQHLVLGRE